MSATSGHNLAHVHSFSEARQRKLQRVLEEHGPLTREHLCALAHAHVWPVSFDVVVERAVHAGLVRRLSEDLFEAGAADRSPAA